MKAWLQPWPALAFAAALLAAACSQVRNPATGQLQYTSLSPQDEARIGQTQHPQILAEFGGAYADAKIQAYVSEVGLKLAAVSDVPDESFTFTLLDSDVVNAFALPGGYVYLTRGLVALVDNEAELAGVLGHEIGHVAARHTAQRYDRQVQSQIGAAAAQIGGAILGGIVGGEGGAQLGGQLAGQLGSVGAEAYVQGYSREQEFQADELGVRYLARAGYDPEAMATFLKALNRNESLSQKVSASEAAPPSWLASHPRTVDRVERAVAAAGSGPGGGATDRPAFLAAVDGLVFGDNPAHGFVRGRSFIHPEMGIRFEAPPGFRLQNTPTSVIGSDESGSYMLFDATQAAGILWPLNYLQEQWITRQRLSGQETLSVAGHPAALAFGRAAFRGQPVEAMFATVAGPERLMYRFLFFRTGGMSEADVRGFRASLMSFGSLGGEDRADAVPLRIEVMQVQPGDTVESLSQRMDMERDKRDWFLLINHVEEPPLQPGTKVKLISRGRPTAAGT